MRDMIAGVADTEPVLLTAPLRYHIYVEHNYALRSAHPDTAYTHRPRDYRLENDEKEKSVGLSELPGTPPQI